MSRNITLPDGLYYWEDDEDILHIDFDEDKWEKTYDKFGFFMGFKRKEKEE